MNYIRDDEFIRGTCPMTKEEIRILSVSKMELKEDYNVLDIGAGTGSVSIQASCFCPSGTVTAIEKDEEAIQIILENKEKFKTLNLTIITGEALEIEKSINIDFDAIFIGGSGGNIEDIIKTYSLKLKNHRKMVLNFITIDNLYKAMKTLKELGFMVECSQISVSKTKGKTFMLFANNPIFILEATKELEDYNG